MAKGRKKKTVRTKTAKTKVTAKAAVTAKGKNSLTDEITTSGMFEQLKLSESYISLILGAIVVLCLAVLFFVFLRSQNIDGKNKIPNSSPAKQTSSSPTPSVKRYVLEEGEGLWDVAVKFYGDGYRWIDIAKANHLENTADTIEPGTHLIIPNIK